MVHSFFVHVAVGSCLSVAMVASLLLADYIFKYLQPFNLLYPSVFRREGHKLLCFDLDVTLSPELVTMKDACRWMLWNLVVVALAYFWHSAVAYRRTFAKPNTFYSSEIALRCSQGYDCFAHTSKWDVSLVWRFKYLNDICGMDATAIESLNSYITCCGFHPIGEMRLITQLVLTMGLYTFYVMLFQHLAWILYWTTAKLVLYVTAAVAFLCYGTILTVKVLSIGQSWQIQATVWLGIPVLMTCALVLSIEARRLRHKRLVQMCVALDTTPIESLKTAAHGTPPGLRSRILQDDNNRFRASIHTTVECGDSAPIGLQPSLNSQKSFDDQSTLTQYTKEKKPV